MRTSQCQPDRSSPLDNSFDNHSTCPHCNCQHDFAAAAGGAFIRPEPNSLSLCIQCGEWSFFNQDRTSLRKITSAEMFKLSMSDDYPRMARLQVLVKLKARFGRIPDAIIGVKMGPDGQIQGVNPLPPEVLDPFL